MAVCEGNLQGMQPKDRASSVSPRYQMKEPRVNPWVLSFGGGESSGFGRRFAKGRDICDGSASLADSPATSDEPQGFPCQKPPVS